MAIVLRTQTYLEREVLLATRDNRKDPGSLAILEGTWTAPAHSLAAAQLLKRRDLLVDLGANVGSFCVPVVNASHAACIAVEPLKGNMACLQAAVRANRLRSRFAFEQAAIVEMDGEVAISQPRPGTSSGVVGLADASMQVPGYSLDGLMARHDWPAVSMLKIDTEGCELRAINGGQEFYARNPDVITIFEANLSHSAANGYQPQDLLRFFEERGMFIYMSFGKYLVRRTSGDFQERGVADYIATPFKLDDRLSGFKFEEPSMNMKIQQVVRVLTNMKPGYRRAMIAQWNLAPRDVREDLRVQALRQDVLAAAEAAD